MISFASLSNKTSPWVYKQKCKAKHPLSFETPNLVHLWHMSLQYRYSAYSGCHASDVCELQCFFRHLLPQVWHSRSLNYVWTASNILYRHAHTTYFIFLGTDAQSNSPRNYDDLLKMSPNTLLVRLQLVSVAKIVSFIKTASIFKLCTTDQTSLEIHGSR